MGIHGIKKKKKFESNVFTEIGNDCDTIEAKYGQDFIMGSLKAKL